LRAHSYRYVGVLLGQRLERCERCGKARTRPLGSPRLTADQPDGQAEAPRPHAQEAERPVGSG